MYRTNTCGELRIENAGQQVTLTIKENGSVVTGISLVASPAPQREGSSYWYTLDGRRLSGKPVQKGIYINNGRKIAIK